MYYYRSRYYSPNLGRFLQTDTIGSKDDLNLYAYTHNDPLNGVDPMGTCTGSHIENSDGTCASTGGNTTGIQGALEGLHHELNNVAGGLRLFAANNTPTTGQVVNGAVNTAMVVGAVASDGAAVPEEIATEATVKETVEGFVTRLFHRLGDSDEAIESIKSTGQLSGKAPRNFFASDIPKVKAYEGPLPAGRKGFEFTTDVAPDVGHVPGKPTWSGNRPGVTTTDDTATIECTVTYVCR